MDLAAFFNLADFIRQQLAVSACTHTFTSVEQWLAARQDVRESVLYWLEEHECACDCKVLRLAEKWEVEIEKSLNQWRPEPRRRYDVFGNPL